MTKEIASTFPAAVQMMPAEYFGYAALTLFTGNFLLFLVVQICGKKDNSWIDVMWSLSFCFPQITIWILRLVNGYGLNLRMIITTALVVVWALRLSLHIGIRHTSEDYRYKEMRENWTAQGCYYLKAFGYVYVLQGAFSVLNASSLYYVNLWSIKDDNTLYVTDYIGIAIWVIGFVVEWLSDQQLTWHLARKKQPGEGKFIKTGLWRYSRHPNYFGEVVMWYGISLIACSMQWGWITIYSAVFMNVCIRFLSGVPFPEKKYADNAEWQQYCRETNVFCLWFASPEENQVSAQKIASGSDEEMVKPVPIGDSHEN